MKCGFDLDTRQRRRIDQIDLDAAELVDTAARAVLVADPLQRVNTNRKRHPACSASAPVTGNPKLCMSMFMGILFDRAM